MDLFQSAAGFVRVELTSGDHAASLQAITGRNIPVYEVRQTDDLTTGFTIRRHDYRELLELCRKRGETLRLQNRLGLYWPVKAFCKRPVFLVGMLIMIFAVFVLPTRVLFVYVEGNTVVPTNMILAAAEESGICFMASRREVRSEKVKNALLSAVPDLQWAGVNTKGCVAVISVRERTMTDRPESESGVASIVAIKDGIVDEITVTQGNALCTVGQAVQEGQVLISGYADCGLYIRASSAKGEVYAQTSRKCDAVCLSDCIQRGKITEIKRTYSLMVGKKRINLWKDSGIWDTSCGRIYEKYNITLPGGFSLPVAWIVQTDTFYDTSTVSIDQAEAEQTLSCFAENYVTAQMIAGQILNRSVLLLSEDGIFCLQGHYLCREMIGRLQPEKIGE